MSRAFVVKFMEMVKSVSMQDLSIYAEELKKAKIIEVTVSKNPYSGDERFLER